MASESSNFVSQLALALLVPGIRRADHVDAPLATNHFALFANPANTGADLHLLTRLFLNTMLSEPAVFRYQPREATLKQQKHLVDLAYESFSSKPV
jgi:hypothetical protein